MPENMILGLAAVVAFVRRAQGLCLTFLQSRRRSGRKGASRDIGANERDASEVDEQYRRPTPLQFLLPITSESAHYPPFLWTCSRARLLSTSCLSALTFQRYDLT